METIIDIQTEGARFELTHNALKKPVFITPEDTLKVTIYEGGSPVDELYEKFGVSMQINTISILRFKDALGFKECVGVLIGERYL